MPRRKKEVAVEQPMVVTHPRWADVELSCKPQYAREVKAKIEAFQKGTFTAKDGDQFWAWKKPYVQYARFTEYLQEILDDSEKSDA